MDWRSPTGPLVHEHRVIERMIALMREQVAAIAESGHADSAFIDIATDFIRTYADRCHHGKEEDILFRELGTKELAPDIAEAMADLVRDHVRGRELTRRLGEAGRAYAQGEPSALPEIESALRELVDFYPRHIEKEDRHFFKACLAYLTDEEQRAVLHEYEAFDRDLIHEKYRGVVERLEMGD
jgi:hemerythrin-like domain-containing protein